MRSPQRTKGARLCNYALFCLPCLPSLRSGSPGPAGMQGGTSGGQAWDEEERREYLPATQRKRETRGRLCPAMAAAAAANYNFAWRRGSARGCATELRARRGETRRREEKKEADGRHNFHLGKLPATIKILGMRAERRRRLHGRRRRAFFSLSIMTKLGDVRPCA